MNQLVAPMLRKSPARVPWPALVAIALATALLFPLPAASAPSPTIKIVSSMPRAGSSKGQTDSIVNGFRMALAEANYRAGGFEIRYEDLDDANAAGAWDGAREAQNANTAVSDPDVMVYLGTFNSGAAKASIPILCRAGLVQISPANTYPGLTKKLDGFPANEPDIYYPNCARNYARVIPSDELQGVAAARWARDLGAQRIYLLDDGEQYGQMTAWTFARAATHLGLHVVGGPEPINPRASEYSRLATWIQDQQPDLVYFGGITQNNAGKLWQDLRATLGQNVKLMGPDGIYEQAFLGAAGQAAEGSYMTFGAIPPSKLTGRGAEWYQRYKDQFKAEPEAYAAYGYEAAKVALNAIQRAGRKDRAAIRDAVFATRGFDGVLGAWSLLPSGDTSLATMSGRVVANGRFDDANAVLLSGDAGTSVVAPAGPLTRADAEYMFDMVDTIRGFLAFGDQVTALGQSDSVSETVTRLHALAQQLTDTRDRMTAIAPTPRFGDVHAELLDADGALADSLEQLAQALDDGDAEATGHLLAHMQQAAVQFRDAAERWSAVAKS